ncbi:MAG TPA: aminoacyl-tRNA hydrolase [Clostridiales bacterium]|nr:aminoacyl-tRNA hydrolase [Clostridiales bacterium]
MYIIIGLGNPSKEYDKTRHNVGWDAIEQIASDNNIPLDFVKFKAICGKGYIGREKVVLAKPMTYMNLSGESVKEIQSFYKVPLENIIIIFDDISLNVGQVRIRKQGTAGGHNGIKSIINHLDTKEFSRIKIGIGDKPAGWDLADYVLSRFRPEEQELINEALSLSSKACKTIVEEGIDDAMNQYNKKNTN